MMDDLLLHICCGPCTSAALPAFRASGCRVTGFFFNPNIHPLLEYRRRLTGAREAAERSAFPLLEDPLYDPLEWFSRVTSEEGARCARCLGWRLDRTAEEARARGCRFFSTTLSISPWQDHEAMRLQGEAAAERHGVEFVYEDLRSLYQESRRLSREWGLYRQKYCGCLVSEWERYARASS